MEKVNVVWFRQDLRLSDHKALYFAMKDAEQSGAGVLGLFHIHPSLNESFTVRHDYFFRTLEDLAHEASGYQFPIHFIAGEVEEAFQHLLDQQDFKVRRVFYNQDEVGFGRKRDEQVEKWLNAQDIEVERFVDAHIHGATEVEKKSGGYYQVFTPYYRMWSSLEKPGVYHINKQKLSERGVDYTSSFQKGQQAFQELVQKCTVDWNHIGERSAIQRLAHFLHNKVDQYEVWRDYPAKNATSMISPYLKNGVLSPRTVYHKIMEIKEEYGPSKGLETYLSEIAWRDFYNMIYYIYPNSKDEEVSEQYQGIDWNQDEEYFELWKQGKTGFPIIDAAMRQLNTIGWMHNRLRMAVASFLTKDYLMDWRKGEQYFEERLIDYDPASNIGGWQWAASTGTDAVPYFRVFNPTRQSERFDPEGEFIKTYIPELKNVPKKYIHEPSKMSEAEQERYGCIIGRDYPEPTVDHKTMRKRAIEVFENQKNS